MKHQYNQNIINKMKSRTRKYRRLKVKKYIFEITTKFM